MILEAPRLDWAWLLKRTFALDVFACLRCGGRLRLIYMRSLRNLDLGLKDLANPANPRDLVENWTMVLSEAVQPLSYAPPSR